jgi:hypothetical protein
VTPSDPDSLARQYGVAANLGAPASLHAGPFADRRTR